MAPGLWEQEQSLSCGTCTYGRTEVNSRILRKLRVGIGYEREL
ncbi:hypothetical protein TPASS_0916 [Treponema pallidum subsp. pallidum SS14]|uniref:Uncharacterized protein TP_0916 n=2 Tax=Treponema pallidum subsp. pallidum TaxID=161 RepID=Y916_TREPA|nr:RecName: Full=Uncharacterized protein TP_0916 [Treponema pallidum subsp. pallidum str. Nichols]AAC65877.1 predicted coding region TP0916 [Treponema pallidum subsp. pallidum str. Nichols]ACD71332.1 hypothetical protein TPASS_0916 [Treponema pallidum subsp. pallidum SS14]